MDIGRVADSFDFKVTGPVVNGVQVPHVHLVPKVQVVRHDRTTESALHLLAAHVSGHSHGYTWDIVVDVPTRSLRIVATVPGIDRPVDGLRVLRHSVRGLLASTHRIQVGRQAAYALNV